MAVAFDASSSSGGGGGITLPHTCSGADRLLLVFVCDWTGGDASGLTVNPSYNGIAMTLYPTHAFSTARVEMWYLVAPASGLHNITYSNGGPEAVVGLSLNGVDQTNPLPSGVATVDGPNPPVTNALTIPSGDMWVEALCILCGSSPTPGAGFTPQATVAPCNPKALTATRAGTGASLSDAWVTALGDGRWADLALRVQQVAVAAPAARLLASAGAGT